MIIRKYTDWENIFLDTSIIFSLLRSLRDDKDDVCNFVKKLLADLENKKSSKNRNRNFYISSITISETLEKLDLAAKATKIVRALNSENVIFHPFDNYVADFMVTNYHSKMNPKKQTAFARSLSWPEHDLHIAREWINKDLMIIATAHYLNCDTILTVDKKTMYPIAEDADFFCALCYPENFQHSHNGKTIFNYDKPKKDKKEKS